jgi:hypothetical protein
VGFFSGFPLINGIFADIDNWCIFCRVIEGICCRGNSYQLIYHIYKQSIMKKLIKTALFSCLFSMAFMAANAQHLVVRVRPSRPAVVVKRTPAPANGHVWVNEDWTVQGNSYTWHGGYWVAPPRKGARYVKGHWRHTRQGDEWVPGHWK